MLLLVTDPKARPNTAPEVKHTVASKLRIINANPLLEARGLITRPSKNKVAESKTSNLVAGRNTGQLNKLASSFAAKPSLRHTSSFKSSISFKKTVKPTDPIANHKQSSGVYSVPIKRCSSGPLLDRSQYNDGDDDDDKKIRRIHSVANIQGKVFLFVNIYCLRVGIINLNYINKICKSRLN
jgi:hypothetical protein